MHVERIYVILQALLWFAVVFVVGWGALLAASGADRQLTLSVTLGALILLAWLGTSVGQMRNRYLLEAILRRLEKLEETVKAQSRKE